MEDLKFKYELFFELSPDLLCIAGFDGYFKKINSSVSKVLGYTMEELYARPINDFVYHEDRDLTDLARKDLTERIPLYNFENRYVTKNGNVVWLSWTSLPVESDGLIFAIAKNITHKKILELERNALITDLARVNDDLKQLNYTTSHDLRSPVNNLLSIFGLIDMSKISDQETIELIGILKLASEKLKLSLNSYVDVITEKQRTHTQPEEVDLQGSLDNVTRSIQTILEVSGTCIRADFSRMPAINFNKAYMESVFLNLITNSIKYARPGCPPVLTIHSEQCGGAQKLIIADNGLGFDMENVKDRIFGLHQKFHNHSDSKGVGLYLVYSHVTAYSGQINVESKLNEGSKFTISFAAETIPANAVPSLTVFPS
jgi:PAS domain S-box-containing protein